MSFDHGSEQYRRFTGATMMQECQPGDGRGDLIDVSLEVLGQHEPASSNGAALLEHGWRIA
ncbi:hypothetical protein, partial [Pseudomonas sp.]|uniref:hypothetical protein n=1 Tax=Pseudomonas sp. TaxID=306 RepID=UPI003FD7FB1A